MPITQGFFLLNPFEAGLVTYPFHVPCYSFSDLFRQDVLGIASGYFILFGLFFMAFRGSARPRFTLRPEFTALALPLPLFHSMTSGKLIFRNAHGFQGILSSATV
jgi:hypothetical protein